MMMTMMMMMMMMRVGSQSWRQVLTMPQPRPGPGDLCPESQESRGCRSKSEGIGGGACGFETTHG